MEGGSDTYVQRAVKDLSAVHLSTAVKKIVRHDGGVELYDYDGQQFDASRVVIATHPHQALQMLDSVSTAERDILDGIPYSQNSALLHTDSQALPRTTAAKASWNYSVPSCSGNSAEPVGVHYWMNKLYGLDEPADYVVSLNADDIVDKDQIVTRRQYEHPIFTAESLAAKNRLAEITAGRTAYAGAYHGWGFHEDGCRSGVAAARAFGVQW